jgi:hypothetical protein
MLDDLYQGACSRMVLISGDSDLVPAIELITARLSSIKVHVYIPVPLHAQTGHRERSYKKELRTVSTTVKELPGQLLQHCLLPNTVLLPDGSTVQMPAGWAAAKGPKIFSAAPIAAGACGWCGKVADASWRLNRVAAMETNLLNRERRAGQAHEHRLESAAA